MAGLALPDRLRITLGALRARRARAAGDTEGYRREILAIVERAFANAPGGAPAALRGPLARCSPIGRSQGGFFSCLAEGQDGARLFVKCVPALGREAQFWQAWSRGAIRAEGEGYRLLPPVGRIEGRALSFLVFPDLGPDPGLSRRRTLRYTSDIETVIRAIAGFNADHLARIGGLKRASGARAHFVPMKRRIVRALAVDGREARQISRALRRVEWRWPALRRGLYRGPLCLCHMDFGPGNVLLGRDRPVILDFGHAAMAPVGADLHTVLRYARKGGTELATARAVEIYAGVFEARGVTVDRAAVTLAAEAHFAARYRNLRLGSAPDVFEEALGVSQRLLAR